MGAGTSNQVRSRPDKTNETVCSPTTGNVFANNKRNDNVFLLNENDVIQNQSKTSQDQKNVTLQKNIAFKSQKISEAQISEIRSLPSPSLHIRRNSSEKKENAFRNLSRHDLHKRLKELEVALALSENHNSGLQNQLQTLEERCTAKTDKYLSAPSSIKDTVQEMLISKDQQIAKLEEDFKNVHTNFQKKISKLKKQIRKLTKENFELRQEISIIHMEVKVQENDSAGTRELVTPVSSKDSGISHLETFTDNSHTKIIVELSTEISNQGDEIARLKAEVAEKTKQIKKLETALLKPRTPETTSHVRHTSKHSKILNNHDDLINANRKISSKVETFQSISNKTTPTSAFHNTRDPIFTYTSTNNNKEIFEHKPTTLSDSDSDWTEGPSSSNVYRHSAPTQRRVIHDVVPPIIRNTQTQNANDN